jgi:hypothetical protein
MKDLKVFMMPIIAVVVLLLIGCATANFNQRSYQILKTSQSAYDLATDSVINLHKSDLISDADYAKIEEKADKYAEAHNTAVEAIKAFNMGLMTAEQTGNKMTAASIALTELLKIAQPYILKGEK